MPAKPDSAGSIQDVGSTSPAAESSSIRSYLQKRGSSAFADRSFSVLMMVCAMTIFAIVLLIATELVMRSQLSISKFGIKFFFRQAWDPVSGDFGAIPFIYGTLVSSLLALVIAVPLAIGLAVFLTEMCPRFLRGPLAFFTELLAAIPSVVYGLWAVFVLVPLLREHVDPVLVKLLAGPHCSAALTMESGCSQRA